MPLWCGGRHVLDPGNLTLWQCIQGKRLERLENKKSVFLVAKSTVTMDARCQQDVTSLHLKYPRHHTSPSTPAGTSSRPPRLLAADNDTAVIFVSVEAYGCSRFHSISLPTPSSYQLNALSTGWNAVGITSTIPITARDTFYSVSTQWATLIGFDAKKQAFEMGIVNGGSGVNTDARTVCPGKGYWLYMAEPGTLCAVGA
jgi:hypothetical protein